MDNDFDNIDFEEWEGDSFLIEDEDWPSLVKLRKQRAEKRPSDFFSQWSYGEALIFNREFKRALEFLTPIYKKEPNHPDVIHSILNALYGLGKTENEFNWIENPAILKLNDKTIKLCVDFLKQKRKPIPFLSLFEYLIIEFDYVKFQEKELLDYLKNVGFFEFSDIEKEFWDVDIKLLKKLKS